MQTVQTQSPPSLQIGHLATSDQGLHGLLTEFSMEDVVKMKTPAETPKQEVTSRIWSK